MPESAVIDELVEQTSRSLSFLDRGGEMGEAMRALDWSQTPVGEPAQWPSPVKAAIGIMLSSGHPMFVAWGPQLTFCYNDAYIALLGAKHPALGRNLQDVWRDVWPAVASLVAEALAGEPTWVEDYHLETDRKGYPEEAFFTFSFSPLRDEQGEVAGVFCAANETTGKVYAGEQRNAAEAALLRSQEQLRQSNEYLNSIISQASVGIAQTDVEGRFMLVNDRYCEILGRSRSDLLGRTVRELTHPDDQLVHADAFAHVVRTGEALFVEKRGVRPDGSHVWVNNHLSLSRDHNGVPQHVIKVAVDVTERKESELHIKYLATHDSLTDLPNRTQLKQKTLHAIQSAQHLDQQFALLFLDLNRFKIVNDSLGHDQGDVLLKIIAGRLRDAIREGDTAARIGGDEFVILLDGVESISEVIQLAEKVLTSVAQPVRLAGHDVSVSTSIGVSVYPRDGSDATLLLKAADTAMYQAKELGGGTFRFYSPDMNVRLLERLLTESRLRQAIGLGELVMHYQPRVDIADNRIVALEALVRWAHPENGLMLPDDFIPIAEEIGLIEEVGRAVLMLSCEQNVRWQAQGYPPVRISVNISPRQLSQGNLPQIVRSVLETTGLEAKWLELEVTESGLMHNIGAAQETLQQIRDLGVGISIDDFGTGYSSLSHLKRLPIDTLKIDKTFVRDLPDDSDDVSIVTATIALAKNMNLRVVAEGVRNLEQLYFLADRECDEAQGYLFGWPVSAEDMEVVLMNPAASLPSCRR